MTEEDNENLSEKVYQLLSEKDYTIPSLCEKLNLQHEFDVLMIIEKLESDNKIALKGFKPIYREDGGSIHLAVYGKSN